MTRCTHAYEQRLMNTLVAKRVRAHTHTEQSIFTDALFTLSVCNHLIVSLFGAENNLSSL